MKNKILPILFALVGVFTTNQASAYYSPSTGRWLSRDPVGEPGFEALRSASIVPGVGQVGASATLPASRIFVRDSVATKNDPNRYAFVNNMPADNFDELGLSVGTVSVLRFQPWVENGFPKYAREWIANFQWSPPTGGAWSQPCNCKPCQQVVWTQSIAWGPSDVHDDWGTDYAIQKNYYWDCSIAKANGVMWDDPGTSDPFLWMLRMRSPITFYATSVATCTSGADAGKKYATVVWGFKWTYDSTPTGLGPIIE